MHLDRYAYQANETFITFTFESRGPNGVIKKVINYQSVPMLFKGLPVVNLAFGDWNDDKQKVDDSTISNNNDRDKVLSTVASTLLAYTDMHGKRAIFARGITPAKTRLYQMSINAQKIDIEKLFEVYGLYNQEWSLITSGINYEAFLAIRK